MLAGSFSLWEAVPPFLDALQEGDCPDACKGFVLVYWGWDPLVLWLSAILTLIKRHLQSARVQGLLKAVQVSTVCVMPLPEVHLCWGQGWKMSLAHSFPWRGEFVLLVFRKPSQKSEQTPLLCPRLLSHLCLHHICIQVICLPISTVLLCFVQAHAWVSKFKILGIYCSIDTCSEMKSWFQ